jgi:hypothetical protein
MSEFNKIVNRARGKLSPEIPVKMARPVEYILLANGYGQEVWPSAFKFPPRPGDSVVSESGRRLKISSIIHSSVGVIIELSRDLGGSEGTSGGGGGKLGPMEV